MSTEQAHLESYERDLANDFKDIDKRYTAQLVQVKVVYLFPSTFNTSNNPNPRFPTWRTATSKNTPKPWTSTS